MSNEAPRVAMFMFDVAHQSLTVEQIKEKVTSHPDVVDWWNYIPGCYLLRMTSEPYKLTDYLTGVNGFVVAEIHPMSLSGRLSKTAWEQLFGSLMKDRSNELVEEVIARRGRLPFELKK